MANIDPSDKAFETYPRDLDGNVVFPNQDDPKKQLAIRILNKRKNEDAILQEAKDKQAMVQMITEMIMKAEARGDAAEVNRLTQKRDMMMQQYADEEKDAV